MSRTNPQTVSQKLQFEWSCRESWLKNKHFNVHYMDFTPKGETKYHCFFFHGTGNDLLYPNLDLFDALLKEGVQVTSFDLPGHGKHSQGFFDAEFSAIYISLLTSYIQKTTSPPQCPIFFCGYSVGCTYANTLAAHFKAPVVDIAAPSTLQLFKLRLPFFEAYGFFRAYFQTKHFGFWNLIPAVLWVGRNRFPLRLKQGGIIENVVKLSKILQSPGKRLQVFGKYDLISPAPNHLKEAKIYKAAHFDLIFHRIMFDDIIGFIHECFTKN